MCGDGPSKAVDTGEISTKAPGPRANAPQATMEPEAAQDSDAPIESTAPL